MYLLEAAAAVVLERGLALQRSSEAYRGLSELYSLIHVYI